MYKNYAFVTFEKNGEIGTKEEQLFLEFRDYFSKNSRKS